MPSTSAASTTKRFRINPPLAADSIAANWSPRAADRAPMRVKMTPPALMWPSPVAYKYTVIGSGNAPGDPFAHLAAVIVTAIVFPEEVAEPLDDNGPPPQNVADVS